MFGSLGAPELLIIFLIVLLVFGGKRVGELGGSLGRAVREFRDALKEEPLRTADKAAIPQSPAKKEEELPPSAASTKDPSHPEMLALAWRTVPVRHKGLRLL